jgi:hypothetical protein
MACEKLPYEQLQEEYERITGIVCEVSGVLALAARIVREPLEKDEATGLGIPELPGAYRRGLTAQTGIRRPLWPLYLFMIAPLRRISISGKKQGNYTL